MGLPMVTEIYHRDLTMEHYVIPYLRYPYVSFYTGRGCRGIAFTASGPRPSPDGVSGCGVSPTWWLRSAVPWNLFPRRRRSFLTTTPSPPMASGPGSSVANSAPSSSSGPPPPGPIPLTRR